MEMNPAKRRKLGPHSGSRSANMETLAFQQASTGGTSQPNIFALEAQELLKEVRLDYKTAFPEVDRLLLRLKELVGRIEPHEPIPVSMNLAVRRVGRD